MKNNKVIIYDDDCPLCAAYTNVFLKIGLLQKEGRKNFANIDAATFALVDQSRCNNEIPLVDTDTNQVWYGIDAMLEILGQKIPFIKSAGNVKPVKYFLNRLYKFISFNRKVIVAIPPLQKKYDCSPSFNTGYRIYFLLFFLFFNSIMLLPFYPIFLKINFIQNRSFIQLQLAHFALFFLNIIIAFLLKRKQGLEYLGQINMLALITILLLIPLYFFIHFFGNNSSVVNIYFGFITCLLLSEYWRRMKYAGITKKNPQIILLNVVSLILFLFYLGT